MSNSFAKLWGPGAEIYHYIAESVRSMLPAAARLGIAAPFPLEVNKLERLLRDEVVACGSVLASPLVVGAWCRLP